MLGLLLVLAGVVGGEAEGNVAAHPRLLLDANRADALRRGLTTTHAWLWQRYLHDVPRMVAVAKGDAPLEDVRYRGDLVPTSPSPGS